jgi:hypothetical protein
MTAPGTRPAWLVPVVAAPLLLSLPFFFGSVLLFRDILQFVVPLQTVVARAFAEGRLPQWNPYKYGGTAILPELDAGVFYPPNLIFHVLAPARAATVFVLLHLPLAGFGTYLLARTLGLTRRSAAIAATGFVTSGYLLSMHGGHLYFASAAWLPLETALLLRLVDRPTLRGAVVAAGGILLLVLNGELQVIAFAAVLGAILALTRPEAMRDRARSMAWVFGALGLGVALSAVQLWPTLLYLASTTRSHGVPLEQAASWAFAPVRWIELLVPLPFGISFPDNGYWGALFLDASHRLPWAPSLYVGPLFVVLAAATPWRGSPRWVRALLIAAAASLVLSAGQALPFFAWWHRWVPLANRFRYPEKFALVTTLTVTLLGGWAIDELQRRPAPWRSWLLFGVGGALGLAAVVVGFHPAGLEEAVARGLALGQSVSTSASALTALVEALAHAAVAAAAFGLLLRFAVKSPESAERLLLAMVLIDGIWAGQAALSFGDGRFLAEPPEVAETIRAALLPGSAGRFWRDQSCVFPGGGDGTLLERVRQWEWRTGKENFLEASQLPDIIGYGAAESQDKLDVFHAVGRQDPLRAVRLFGGAVRLRCLRNGEPEVVPLADPLPRAFVVPALEESPVGLLERLADPSFDFSRLALVEEPLGPVSPGAGPGEAKVVEDQPEAVRVNATSGGGMLVLADSFAPGWDATVDGLPAPIFRVDGLWRGVQLSPGAHDVWFRYRTPGLLRGAAVSLVALLAACLLFFWPRARGARHRDPAKSPE